jgi:hypothetical protein
MLLSRTAYCKKLQQRLRGPPAAIERASLCDKSRVVKIYTQRREQSLAMWALPRFRGRLLRASVFAIQQKEEML